jgi:uncharacterized membrane protein
VSNRQLGVWVPTLAYLSRNMWARGELTEPKLVVVFPKPTESYLTLRFYLADYNGVRVTDIYTRTIPADVTQVVVELGDYLDAQQRAKGFGSGVYVLVVEIVENNEVFILPLMVTLGYVSLPELPDREHLRYFTVLDRVLGVYFNIPPVLDYIPSDPRFMVFAYFHRGNKGRLIKFNFLGDVELDTGYHQLALITLTLRFSSVREMLTHMLAHCYGVRPAVAQGVLEAIDRGDYRTALDLLRPFYMVTFLGRMLTAEFDTEKYEIRIKSQVFLGQWDWDRIIRWGAIGCGIAVIAVAAVTAVTAGVGAITAPLVLGSCIAGGAVGAYLAVESSASSDRPDTVIIYIYKIRDEGEKAKRQNEEYYSRAKGVLDRWLAEGKITAEDYNLMITALDDWKSGMDAAIDDIVGVGEAAVKEAYRSGYSDGYRKGVSESRTWIIGAGVGGLLVGLLLGRR